MSSSCSSEQRPAKAALRMSSSRRAAGFKTSLRERERASGRQHCETHAPQCRLHRRRLPAPSSESICRHSTAQRCPCVHFCDPDFQPNPWVDPTHGQLCYSTNRSPHRRRHRSRMEQRMWAPRAGNRQLFRPTHSSLR